MRAKAPLSILPLQTILRSLAVTTISSSPFLLSPSLAIMNVLAHTNNGLLNPDRNPLLKLLIKSTFYAQFCAGENAAEVRSTVARLKGLGFSGVILGYAKEVVLTDAETRELSNCGAESKELEEHVKRELTHWAQGTLETVRLADEGDFVALKFTGAGRQALWTLSERLPPPKALADAIDEICMLAVSRGVRLLFDAEQQAVQHGIDDWTLEHMRKYNKPSSSSSGPAKAVIYGTYQAYLKATPSVLASHLHAAQQEGFTLGVKLVRGAYLGSDPRHLIHDTKADTDACYNGIAEALLRRQWAGPLAQFAQKGGEKFPAVNMVLASHNADTVRKARSVLEEGPTETEVAFAQLQGMADEVSCEILASKDGAVTAEHAKEVFKPRAYKYLVWGSTGECMKYLLRRAQENRDAVGRTQSGRDAMKAEVWRRVKTALGVTA
ncbi:FAD-linked oxidoreductase [Cryphonectria parasitica EP155]|uniref:Proline dehydrogenase n=1 Tax=Cryphonectria parasitica (strain ATCC 38755 / EP155) TaxID=660469 RepID=A0A9P5CM96_CRYP1|nr:FAD-linked oxidoreductase [Cryphonectria parasitica EP155]KAF3764134.1 FAD-linked oxidoreductase [Cryphonectria parasitica EP155]